ncbi:MAG TPA: hypothetical protein DCY35_04540 [Prolixibacteraceae bacterium]|nr:hypothetical protein [Prolixibacteraceae bacterium]
MKALEQIDRLITMNNLIRTHHTGSPEQFCKRMNISRRQLFTCLEFLRDCGVEIEFSRAMNSYHYKNGHELEINFKLAKVPASRLISIIQ